MSPLTQDSAPFVDCIHIRQHPKGHRAFIALTDLHIGPAIGGCRIIPNPEKALACHEVSRLAVAMKEKAQLHQLPHGGGKSLLYVPPEACREEAFTWFSEFLNELNGQYITAIDSGTSPNDMDIIQRNSPFVLCGNNQPLTSKCTALGTFYAIRGACNALNIKIDGARVHLQGLGAVGFELLKMLHEQGADVYSYDINPQRCSMAEQFSTIVDSLDTLYDQPSDIWSPCALANTVNTNTVHRIQTKVICGAANNQLSSETLAEHLHRRKVHYINDVLANGGGLIYASGMHRKSSMDTINKQLSQIEDQTKNILHQAITQHVSFASALKKTNLQSHEPIDT